MYGIVGAPYLTTKTLNQLANDEGHNFSKPTAIILRDFYVDDVLIYVKNIQEGAKLICKLQKML